MRLPSARVIVEAPYGEQPVISSYRDWPDALLVLNVGGVDDSSAQQLYARHVYSWRDIRWQHRYKDITSVSPLGRFLLDYTKFHDTVREE